VVTKVVPRGVSGGATLCGWLSGADVQVGVEPPCRLYGQSSSVRLCRHPR